jgi:uncharacterized membrane protein
MMNEGDYFFSSDNANDEDECSNSSNNIVERITSAKLTVMTGMVVVAVVVVVVVALVVVAVVAKGRTNHG